MKKATKAVVAIVACLTISCASSSVPRANTRADVQQYVERAAQLVRERGADTCASFRTARWTAGDYYIFMTNADTSVTVCHPARPELVGRNESDLRDANGKYFMREMLAVANERAGGGWVEYLWPRPGETDPAVKSTFVINVAGPDGTRYLVGSGGYDMAP